MSDESVAKEIGWCVTHDTSANLHARACPAEVLNRIYGEERQSCRVRPRLLLTPVDVLASSVYQRYRLLEDDQGHTSEVGLA